MGNRIGVWLMGTVRRKLAKERWDRSNLEMVVAVPWRQNEDDPEMNGECLKSEVVVMDKVYKEKLPRRQGHSQGTRGDETNERVPRRGG